MRFVIVALVLLPLACTRAWAGWEYRDQQDQMGAGTVKGAKIESTNVITFGAPYGGPQRATLLLRVHPRHGRDVMLSIERGQFLCRVDGCSVLVRFDDKKAERFAASEPADHSTTTVFIRDYSRFVQSIKTAKQLRIEAPFFQQGSKILEFEVSGLKWETPPPPPKSAAWKQQQLECNHQANYAAFDDREKWRVVWSDCMKAAGFKP